MFTTRLNPTKPPAAHRAVLERVGMACRELRPIEQECLTQHRRNDRIASLFAKHNVFGIGIDAKHGGVGTDPLLSVLAAERIGREGNGPLSFFATHTAAAAAIANCGSLEQQAAYLPRAARGDCVLGLAWYETRPADRLGLGTVFRETASGFTLTGPKPRAVNAELGGAVLVFARGHADEAMSAFVVNGGSAGFPVTPGSLHAGWGSGAPADVQFVNCELARGQLLGEQGGAPAVAWVASLVARLTLAGGAVGVMADCLEIAAEQGAKLLRAADSEATHGLREQTISRHIGQTAADLEAARALVYAAVDLKAEFDRRPTNEHLKLETDTLVTEAWFVASSAMSRMMARMGVGEGSGADAGENPVVWSLPPRHALVPRPTLHSDENPDSLLRQIAQYYLFL